MSNLDSIFKSRDITLPTKVHLVKAMVFPVVMHGCESWPVKKAKRQRIDAFFFNLFFYFTQPLGSAGSSCQGASRRAGLGVSRQWCALRGAAHFTSQGGA